MNFELKSSHLEIKIHIKQCSLFSPSYA